MRELLVIALVLACPLMMILMMRGHGHGHSHGADDRSAHHEREHSPVSASTVELRRQRDALDRLIAERETLTPVAAGAIGHAGDRSASA